MCPMDRMTLRNSKMWVLRLHRLLRLLFLNKLAACFLLNVCASVKCVNEPMPSLMKKHGTWHGVQFTLQTLQENLLDVLFG